MLDIEIIENEEAGFVIVRQKKGNTVRFINVQGKLGHKDTQIAITRAIDELSNFERTEFYRYINLDKD